MKRATILLLVLAACGGSEDEQATDADNPCPPGASVVVSVLDELHTEVWCRLGDGTPHGHARLENEFGCWKVEGFHNYGEPCGHWEWRNDACEYISDREFQPCPY